MKNKEKGAVMVFVALLISLAIVIVVALSIESGRLTYAKNQAQAAVDAAAISAAMALPAYQQSLQQQTADGSNVLDEFVSSLNHNNTFEGQQANIAFQNVHPVYYNDGTHQLFTEQDGVTFVSANGVMVSKQDFPLTHVFAKVVGKNSTNVGASAIARIDTGPSCVEPNLPIVLVAKRDLPQTAPPCSDIYNGMCNDDTQSSAEIPTHVTNSPSTEDFMGYFVSNDAQASAEECFHRVFWRHPRICVGDPIKLNNGSVTSCMKDIVNKFIGLDMCAQGGACTLQDGGGGRGGNVTNISCPSGCTGTAGHGVTTVSCPDGAACGAMVTAVLPVIALSQLCDSTGQCNFNQTANVIGFAHVAVNQITLHGDNNPAPMSSQDPEPTGGTAGDPPLDPPQHDDGITFKLLCDRIHASGGGPICTAKTDEVTLIR